MYKKYMKHRVALWGKHVEVFEFAKQDTTLELKGLEQFQMKMFGCVGPYTQSLVTGLNEQQFTDTVTYGGFVNKVPGAGQETTLDLEPNIVRLKIFRCLVNGVATKNKRTQRGYIRAARNWLTCLGLELFEVQASM